MTLTEFLRARFDEEEADARSERGVYPRPVAWDDGAVALHIGPGGNAVIVRYIHPREGFVDMESLRRWATPGSDGWSSQRVLADVEAKRQIVAAAAKAARDDHRNMGSLSDLADVVLTQLAVPYADHPDYGEEWKP